MEALDRDKAIAILNRIMDLELTGIVRYTHFGLMIHGYNSSTVVDWLRAQAEEGLRHAQRAGEMIALLGGHPTLGIGPLQESQQYDVAAILHEALKHENEACAAYYALLDLAQGRSAVIEQYARELIVAEEMHAGQVDRMLRNPDPPAAIAA